EPGDRVAGAHGRRVSGAGEHHGDGGLLAPGQLRVLRELSAGGGQQQRGEGGGEPLQDHLRLRIAEAGVELDHPQPARGERVAAAAAYPAQASTTGTAASSLQVSSASSASSPRAAASSSGAKGEVSRSRTTCVSGSPKRALNSTTRSPREVSARPQYSTPTKGMPRSASSAIVGRATLSRTSSVRPSGAQGRGE